MPVLESGLERSQVAQLRREPLQALKHAIHFALRPLDLLQAHFRQRAAQLIVQCDEALDARHPRLADATIDLTGEIDDLIRLSNHLVHHDLRRMQQSRRDIAPSLIADNRNARRTTPPAARSIAGFDACVTSVDVGDDRVRLAIVADLERHVDRDALLRADDPPEPPYWAHCWSGARVLAERVPSNAGHVLEIGCGLGLPGVVATRRGARVVFADRVAAPLAFVRASLGANGVDAGLVVADVLAAPWRDAFDVVLAAEVLYDRAVFARLAAALRAALAPGGFVLLADGHRIDTAEFYDT